MMFIIKYVHMCKAISLVPSPVVLHGSCFGRDVSDVKIKKNQMNI